MLGSNGGGALCLPLPGTTLPFAGRSTVSSHVPSFCASCHCFLFFLMVKILVLGVLLFFMA
jgi:hypothetical protein